MALRDYARFFRNESEMADEERRETAREVLAWAAHPYHEKFMAWLDEQAAAPIRISNDNLTVVEFAVRANTLREIRKYLLRLVSNAQAALEE